MQKVALDITLKTITIEICIFLPGRLDKAAFHFKSGQKPQVVPSHWREKRKLPAIIEHNNVLDHKGNENVVGGVGRMNFPVVTKYVTA